MIIKQDVSGVEPFFEQFVSRYKLNEVAADRLWLYANLIIEWNEKFNLTSKTKVSSVIRDLFADSLVLLSVLDPQSIQSIADAGTGAGVPGLVLKIACPWLKLVLIEVNGKKRSFLEYVVSRLELQDVSVTHFDWRTFNRKTTYDVDYFVTKAAFSDLEIIRMFRGDCNYRHKKLFYWASSTWMVDKRAAPYVQNTFPYVVEGKRSQLVLFSAPET
jgi:16S rRNA (guanine(527)-N(7))-methyltransferase RsmG